MKICKLCLFLFILLTASEMKAVIRPSFYLDSRAWNSTDIVVVSEGGEIDGKLNVLETLKGSLKPGDVINVPQMAMFNTESSRAIKSGFLREDVDSYVTCSNMILFLKRKSNTIEKNSANNQEGLSEEEKKKPEITGDWESLCEDGVNTSVVWIENGKVYAFIQIMNPGPSVLTYFYLSETEIREHTFEIMRLRDSLIEAIAISDLEKRAAALQPFASSSVYFAYTLAFKELANCRKSALPVLLKMLNDPPIQNFNGYGFDILVEIGGREVDEELTEVVRRELEFWKITAPNLKEGWWNSCEEKERENLRNHYSKLHETLRALRKIQSQGCIPVVKELRDFWRSLPQLEGKQGLQELDDISFECDSILKSEKSR